ncbi:hypothetical protein L3Y34_004131 [Caenorhabditis briggsae]|uniref:Uncharacterized protein n=1 Tax=Caenorhabditis briggsae TaxID=6238 RepID=A0AAE9AH27_CAEBR|nr:hypothetical protein L3Y34_004131 [Caenorhabditis briggsae]
MHPKSFFSVPSPSDNLDCRSITCFGSSNCTTIPKIEDVIRQSLNFTDDYKNYTLANGTWNLNMTSSDHCISLFSVILQLSVVFIG